MTLYARIIPPAPAKPETVALSTSEACGPGCEPAGQPEFQGASADGTRVFFTAGQQLYEYDFARAEGHHLVEISEGTAHAEVQGVVRTSPDGSHVTSSTRV